MTPRDRPGSRPAPSRSVEKHAWRDLFAGAPPLPASALGLAGRELGGAFALTASSLESFLFNRVIGLGVERPATDVALDAIAGALRGNTARASR